MKCDKERQVGLGELVRTDTMDYLFCLGEMRNVFPQRTTCQFDQKKEVEFEEYEKIRSEGKKI